MADSAQAETDPVDSAARGGAALREAREARGIPIEDIATDLRIELRLLEALEREDYGELGAPVFAKGYIRQYATRLGLDAGAIVGAYNEATGFADVRVEPSRAIRLRDGQQITAWIVALLALALVVAFLLVWWLSSPTPVTRPAALADPGTVPFPDAAAGDLTAIPPGPTPAAPGAEAPIEDVAPDTPDSPNAQGVAGPAAVTRTSSDRAPDTADDGSAATDAVSAVPAVEGGAVISPSAPAAGPTVELVFVEDCWVEIVDANGVRLLYGLIEAGSRRVVSGAAPIDVFLGNAEAALITVDGGEFTVPRASRRGNLARFAISARTD